MPLRLPNILSASTPLCVRALCWGWCQYRLPGPTFVGPLLQVSKAKINVEQKPWARIQHTPGGEFHDHGGPWDARAACDPE